MEVTRTVTTDGEAVDAIFEGLKYFIKKRPKTTILALIVLFGIAGYVVRDFVELEKVSIRKVEPQSEAIDSGSSNGLYYAALVGEPTKSRPKNADSLILDGKFYGYYDTTFQIFKVPGEPSIWVHDRRRHDTYVVEVPSLTRENFEQSKKD